MYKLRLSERDSLFYLTHMVDRIKFSSASLYSQRHTPTIVRLYNIIPSLLHKKIILALIRNYIVKVSIRYIELKLLVFCNNKYTFLAKK